VVYVVVVAKAIKFPADATSRNDERHNYC